MSCLNDRWIWVAGDEGRGSQRLGFNFWCVLSTCVQFLISDMSSTRTCVVDPGASRGTDTTYQTSVFLPNPVVPEKAPHPSRGIHSAVSMQQCMGRENHNVTFWRLLSNTFEPELRPCEAMSESMVVQ